MFMKGLCIAVFSRAATTGSSASKAASSGQARLGSSKNKKPKLFNLQSGKDNVKMAEDRVFGPLPEGSSTPVLSREASTSSESEDEVDHEEVLGQHTYSYSYEAIEYTKSEILNGESVAVAGTPMHLMIHPVCTKDDTFLSVFISLDKSDSFSRPIGWEAFVKMHFALVNVDPKKNVTNATQIRFHDLSSSWGFPNFCHIKKAYDPENGFLVDGKLTVEAKVEVVTGQSMAWGAHSKYSSKTSTGFVGLNNQGATCYMNSVLQTLFHTNALRRAVFLMPTFRDTTTTTVALALQRLFYNLQTQSDAVSTTELTKSFGWTSADAFMQHDVQEFLRVLMDNIEEKMKETLVAGHVANLFAGTTRSYIRCTEVDFESAREETFYDVQLNVRGAASVQTALDQYVTPEILDGDNKYQAEGHGLQVAKHGTSFKKLPSVLHLQLKRFEFSLVYEDYVKINDRFEFSDTLDMTKYVLEPNPDGEIFLLHSVLVHSGGAQGGHYFVFVRPSLSGPWLKFNDDTVTKATAKQAIDANFGSATTGKYRDYGTNAYMLVYIRQSAFAQQQRPCEPDDIPQSLLQRFEDDKIARRKKEEEEIELAKSIYVDAITLEYLKQREDAELFGINDVEKAPGVVSILIRRDATVLTLMEEIERATGLAVDRQRLLPLTRKNMRYTLRSVLQPTEIIRTACHYVRQSRWRIFVDSREELADAADSPAGSVMIFVKKYDPSTSKLHFLGQQRFNGTDTLAKLVDELEPGTRIYSDSATNPEEIEPNTDFDELQNGSSIVMQLPLPEGAMSFPDHVNYIENLIPMTFKRKVVEGEPDHSVTLKLDQRLHCKEVAEALAAAIGLDDWRKLQFSEHTTFSTDYNDIVMYRPDATLETMRTFFKQLNEVLVYEVLPLPVEEAQAQCRIQPLFYDRATNTARKLDFFFEKGTTAQQMLEHMSRVIVLPRPLRLFYVYIGSFKIPAPTDVVESIVQRYNHHYLEEVLSDQEELELGVEKDGRALCCVQHIARDLYRTHGVPFIFTLIEGEIVMALRQRLADHLGLPLASIAKWKIGYEYLRDAVVLDDESVVSLATMQRTMSHIKLLLDHPNAKEKRYRSYFEKPVKIHN